MKLCDLIIPTNRQRKEFPKPAMELLKLSIISKGLLHAPVVRNDGVTLISGERRVRAITELHAEGLFFFHNGLQVASGQCPITLLGDLDPLLIREAELEENTIRLDISWQERALALAELKRLREAQAIQSGKPYSTADLSEETTGIRKGTPAVETRNALLLAEHMSIPEVAKAKTQKDAEKVLRKIKETEYRAVLAAKMDLTETVHDLRCGDMRELIQTLPDSTFDLIITDPPYGVGADTFGDMAGTGHNYTDTWEQAYELYQVLAFEGYRVCKGEAHLYTFCDFSHFQEISDLLDLAGWSVWPRPLIWDKGNGMLPRPEHGPKNTYECIIFANKGARKTLCVKPDVIRVSGDTNLLHGAQKPTALYADLISRSCLPGSELFDPFGGSGTVISAAIAARCRATMFEALTDNFNIALTRLKEETSVSEADEIHLEL